MAYLIGFVAGIVAGLFQLWLLSKFVLMITSGSFDVTKALLGIIQFFFPIAVLVGFAFLRRQDLIWVGSGIAAALIVGAFVKFVIYMRNSRGRDKNGA